jgi:hypothetical protein
MVSSVLRAVDTLGPDLRQMPEFGNVVPAGMGNNRLALARYLHYILPVPRIIAVSPDALPQLGGFKQTWPAAAPLYALPRLQVLPVSEWTLAPSLSLAAGYWTAPGRVPQKLQWQYSAQLPILLLSVLAFFCMLLIRSSGAAEIIRRPGSPEG